MRELPRLELARLRWLLKRGPDRAPGGCNGSSWGRAAMRMKQYDAVSSHAGHSVQSVELLLALIQDRQRVAVANAKPTPPHDGARHPFLFRAPRPPRGFSARMLPD